MLPVSTSRRPYKWAVLMDDELRGKPVRTTISDKSAACPLDHVNRQFQASRPNALGVSDFTYVATWTGFVYVAFVIDAYARRIVGWRQLSTFYIPLQSSRRVCAYAELAMETRAHKLVHEITRRIGGAFSCSRQASIVRPFYPGVGQRYHSAAALR